MKTLTFSVFTLLAYAFVPAFYLPVKSFQDKQPYSTKEFTVEDNGKLNIRTSGGSIAVVGQSGTTVKVEMYVKKGGKFLNDEEAKEALENFQITIQKDENTVIAKAERTSGFKHSSSNINISFKAYVPKKINCNLKTSGGSIELDKLIGNQKVETSGGHLDLSSLRGNLNAHTSGGNIQINNYKGKIEAHTSGGNIKVFEAKGIVKVETSGGNINLEEVYGSINANTSGGNIHADIKELGNFVDLHTSGGNITATVPGKVGLNLDLKGHNVNTKLTNFNGESKKDKVVGQVNGGGVPVNLSTSGGSVNLNYQL